MKLLRLFILMAFTIATNVGSSMAAATGRSAQGHLQYAVNQGAWWCFYLTSTQSLSAAYSTNAGTSWSAPTGSPFSLAVAHGSEGRYYGFAYRNISSTDVLHMQGRQYHSRFTLGAVWTNSNAEAAPSGTTVNSLGGNCALDPSNNPIVAGALSSGSQSAAADKGSNADSGTSWTAGWPATWKGYYNTAPYCSSFAAFPLASDTLLLCDNAATASTFTNLRSNLYSTATTVNSSAVFGSAVTAADTNAWGAVGRTTSDIHVVALSNNSNTYVHARYNGSSWSAGDTIPTLTYGTTSGIALVSDGTSVWAFAIDSSGNVQYVQWVSGTGWGSWTQLEANNSNGRAYIVGAYSAANSQIMVIWTENTGANYNICGSILSTSAAPVVRPSSPIIVSFRRAQLWPPPRKATAAPGGNPTRLPAPPSVAPRIIVPPRPTRIVSVADFYYTSGSVVTRPSSTVVRIPAALPRTHRARVLRSPAGNPTAPARPSVFRLPPRSLPRTAAALARSPYVTVVAHGPMPRSLVVRLTPGRGRPTVAQLLTALRVPGIPPVAATTFYMDPYAAVLAQAYLDPTAIDPDSAVLASADSDPFAVDPYSAVLVETDDSDPFALDPDNSSIG